jgi:RNA polymerase sigma-70 factor (ECF subfamily)
MREIPRKILKRAGMGDISAFEQVYRETGGFVYSVALKFAKNRQDAEEITQDVFVSVYRNLKNFAFRSAFRTWVYRITANTALNFLKKNKINEGNTEYIQNLHGASNGPTGEIINSEHSRARLEEMMKYLNPDQRMCIVLRIKGLSYKEIAAALNININTVRSRLKRARERLISTDMRSSENGL